MSVGNTASTNLDMNTNDITNATSITTGTLNYTTLNPPVSTPSLSSVMSVGNTASANLDMNTNNITNATSITTGTLNYTTLNPPISTGATYVSFSPAFTNLTIGNGTVTARYAQQGQFTDVYVRIIFGSSTVMGISPRMTLPVNANFASINTGIGTALNGSLTMRDASAPQTVYGIITLSPNNSVELRPFFSSGNLQVVAQISPTIPFTWANTDEIFFTFSYNSV
jgi:hypothetical protein